MYLLFPVYFNRLINEKEFGLILGDGYMENSIQGILFNSFYKNIDYFKKILDDDNPELLSTSFQHPLSYSREKWWQSMCVIIAYVDSKSELKDGSVIDVASFLTPMLSQYNFVDFKKSSKMIISLYKDKLNLKSTLKIIRNATSTTT